MLDLKTHLKISAVNSLTDGRYFAAMGAEWIGFSFVDFSPRKVSIEQAKEIKNWLSGPRFLGEFGGESIEVINETVKALELDIIEVTEDLDLNKLDKSVQSIIHKIVIDEKMQPKDLEQYMEERMRWTAQFVLEFATPWEEAQKVFSYEFLKGLCASYNVFLKLDFSTENMLTILEKIQPFGIDLRGGDEIQTGLQSFDEMDDILELLEND